MRSAVLALLGRAPTGSRSAWLGLVLTRLTQMLAVVAILLLAAFGWLALSLPVAGPAEPPRPSLLLESTDGRAFATRGAFRGAPVDLADLPPHLTDAVLAIEDRRFRSHLGVDLRGIGRALVANLAAGGVREGGSTITQQLARLLYLSQDRTLRRKLQEAMLAVWLELRLDKDDDPGALPQRGLSRRRRLGRPRRRLALFPQTRPRALPQRGRDACGPDPGAPSDYAPTRDLEAAPGAGSVVLGAMVDAGVLAEETGAAARASPAVPVVEPEVVPGRAYFADWVAGEAGALLGPLSADYAVRTTLDLDLQALAERVIDLRLAAEGGHEAGEPGSAGGARCRWCRAGHGRRRDYRKVSSTGPPRHDASRARCSSSSSTWPPSRPGSRPTACWWTSRSRSATGSRRTTPATSHRSGRACVTAFALSLNSSP